MYEYLTALDGLGGRYMASDCEVGLSHGTQCDLVSERVNNFPRLVTTCSSGM